MKRLGNKGITLTELIIAIGIFGLVMIAIGRALSVSAKTYSKGNEEVNAQNEATAFMNQLDNIIAEAKYGVYVKEDTDALYMVSMYQKSFHILWWDKTSHKVYDKYYEDPAGSVGDIEKKFALDTSTTDTNGKYCYDLLKGGMSSINLDDQLIAVNVDSLGFKANNEYGYVSVYLTIRADKTSTEFKASKNIGVRNLSKGVVSTNSRSNYKNYYGGDTAEEGEGGGSSDGGEDTVYGSGGNGINTPAEKLVVFHISAKLNKAGNYPGCQISFGGDWDNVFQIGFGTSTEYVDDYTMPISVYEKYKDYTPYVINAWGCNKDDISFTYGVELPE